MTDSLRTALWTNVDRLIEDALLPQDAVLAAALTASTAAGLPRISVSPPQGKLLMLLAKMLGARAILEIGTLGGYSTIWLGRALQGGGRLITLEANPIHAEVARQNIARAGLDGIVEVRVGPAIETLPRLAEEGKAPFDLVFIDADKPGTPDYFTWALNLSRPGSVIVVDNVVRDGTVIDSASTDLNITAMRRLIEMAGADARVSATVIQTVGSKGYDGFALALVTS